MAVQDNDKFIVDRGGADYKVSASDLDDKLKDDDKVLINRGGTDYKVSGIDLRKYLGIAKPPWEDAEGIYHVIITDPGAISITAGFSKIYNKDTWAETSINAPGEYIITGIGTSFSSSAGNWEFGPLTDTSKVINMQGLFFKAQNFNQDISSWDVSNVTNMEAMFFMSKAFNQDLTGWCVTNITSEPNAFKAQSGMPSDGSKDPVWGTCPRGEDKP